MKAAVIGAGIAGLTAARELASVGIAEVGIYYDGAGASPFIHGLNIPLCPGDSPEIFRRDTEASGCGLNDGALVERLCGESPGVPEFLARHGIALNRDASGGYALLQPLGSSFPRAAYSGSNTGTRILAALRAELRACGTVREHPHSRALRLSRKDGAVSGFLCYDSAEKRFCEVEADCVVLASGGFCGIYPFSTNGPDSSGDGIAMLYEAGAELTDLEFIQFEPSAAVYPPGLRGKSMITTMFCDGAVLRNVLGERFMLKRSPSGERVNKDVLAFCMAEEIAEGRGTEHGGVFFDASGVSPAVMAEKYAAYRERYLPYGIDLQNRPVELAPAPHTSLGGARIDDACSAGVPGLFAAGEVTGGLHGANRIGGSAGLETLIFGAQAGRSAVRFLAGKSRSSGASEEIPPQGAVPAERLAAMRAEMQEQLRKNLGVVRGGSGLAGAAETFARLQEEALAALGKNSGARPGETFASMRLCSDLRCAQLLALSALERKESAGCHRRSDSGEENRPYNVRVRKGKQGPLVFREYRDAASRKEEKT